MQIWAQNLLPEHMLMYDPQVAPSHFAEIILSPPAVVHILMDEHNIKIDNDVGRQQTYRSEPENYSLEKPAQLLQYAMVIACAQKKHMNHSC